MPRPRLRRRIRFQPDTTYFKPQGIPLINLEESILTFDETEAIRLKDLKGLEQKKCAKKMKISQPTFNRLLSSARKKIADAIINGKSIRIQGGNFQMVQPRGAGRGAGRGQGMQRRGIGPGRGRGMGFQGPASMCICPNCQYEVPKKPGIPCTTQKCVKCGSVLVRAY